MYLVDEQPEVLAALEVDHELLVYTVKKRLTFFPSPAGMSLTKLSLAGKTANLFYSVNQGTW